MTAQIRQNRKTIAAASGGALQAFAVASAGTGQSIPDNTATTINWSDSLYSETAGQTAFTLDASTPPTYVAINEDGVYLIAVNMGWDHNATGDRDFSITGSGTAGEGASTPAMSTVGRLDKLACTEVDFLTAGAHIGVDVWQNSGGNLSVRGRLQLVKLA